MLLADIIQKIVEDNLVEKSYFLVDIKISDSKFKRKITIYLDSDEGITIDQCSTFSRELGDQLEEVIDEAFTLEVSSPGADSPLKLERQYLKNIGRSLKIVKEDLSEVKGKLIEIKNGEIYLEPLSKKKEKTEVISISLNEIKEAKVIISFK